jgi:hypothetical protein
MSHNSKLPTFLLKLLLHVSQLSRQAPKMLELERAVMNRQLHIAPQFSSVYLCFHHHECSENSFFLKENCWIGFDGHERTLPSPGSACSMLLAGAITHKIPRSQRQGGNVSLDLKKKMIVHLVHARQSTGTSIACSWARAFCAFVLVALRSFLDTGRFK